MNTDALLLVAAVASVFSAVLSTAFAVVQLLALIRECRKPTTPPPPPPAAPAMQPAAVEDWRATDADYARWCDEQEAEYFARLEAEDYAAWRLTRAAA
jgi:hypothetical protein